MPLAKLSDYLWGSRAKVSYLLFAAALLLFTLLDVRDIWTQEHRWADIVAGMFYRQDFLHPYLGENNYYDKPLLSYWLIAFFAKIIGQLNTWALRLPSALAGLLAIWSIYRIGTILKNRELGLMSGWMLLTTFYFVFWARTSSADMLNLGGTLFAVCWYFEKRDHTKFLDYTVFFLILALTSLCKGLIGMVVPLLVVFIDMLLQGTVKKHLFNWRLYLALVPAFCIYALPFWASSVAGDANYQQNGLALVYRENILRYFQPFDHKGPIYTYLIYLPLYLLPWTLFFIPALFALKHRWRFMSNNVKWLSYAVLALFLFFTLSGSRRSYYVLPIVPFAILFTAEWVQSLRITSMHTVLRVAWLTGVTFIILFLNFAIIQPLYYSQGTLQRFVATFKERASDIQPWSSWQVVMLDAESKLSFYLQLPPTTPNYKVIGKRQDQTTDSLTKAWAILAHPPANTVFVSRHLYANFLQKALPNYRMITVPPNKIEHWLQKDDNAPVAFIPIKKSS